jgi:hypothetical protein
MSDLGRAESVSSALIGLMNAGNRLADLINEPLATEDEIESAVEGWERALLKAGKEA